MYFFWLLSCTIVTETPQEVKLAKASTEIIFESAEQLGAHKYQAQVRRTEFYNGTENSTHNEEILIEWLDWDNFHYTRVVYNK